jgi:hypothetical protein
MHLDPQSFTAWETLQERALRLTAEMSAAPALDGSGAKAPTPLTLPARFDPG